MKTATIQTKKVVIGFDREHRGQLRGRLVTAFERGMVMPIVSEGDTKNRKALAFSLGVREVTDAKGIMVYSARADQFVRPIKAETPDCWPKGASKSEGIGNSCASTVRTYVRTHSTAGKVWEHLRFVSLSTDSDLVAIVWVD